MENTASHLDRLITTGKLDRRLAFDQGATGPVERASGIDRDLRRDHPYAAYAELPPMVAIREDGDAHARAQVRMAEVNASIMLIQQALDLLPDGAVHVDCKVVPGSEGLGWTESPRGTLFYAVHFDQRRQARARQNQIAIVLKLARVSVHCARQQHDGLRDQ